MHGRGWRRRRREESAEDLSEREGELPAVQAEGGFGHQAPPPQDSKESSSSMFCQSVLSPKQVSKQSAVAKKVPVPVQYGAE